MTAWDVFCTVLGPLGFRLVGLAIIVAALVRRQYRVALFLVLTVELSGIVTELVKAVVDRPRPDTAMVYALSSSFPSRACARRDGQRVGAAIVWRGPRCPAPGA